ncbi:MAG TPA: hypothetical protein HA272_11385 [Methanoregula sp.]|nr:hypothetical protein [Methanoregula sp.]
MKRVFIFLIILLISPSVTADGMMYVSVPPQDSDMWTGEVLVARSSQAVPSEGYEWNLQPEDQQLAAIHYEDGMENLLLSITMDDSLTGGQAVWIYPVPSAPEKVTIDVVKGYPVLKGRDVDLDASRAALSVSGWIMAYATAPPGLMYGYPCMFFLSGFGMAGSPGTQGASWGMNHAGDGPVTDPDAITIHSRIDRMGITSELVTAKTTAALHDYLRTKGMDDPATMAAPLDGYIGEDYSFVITTISNVSEFKAESGTTSTHILGSFARFPTDRIYFPLKPTSVYGSREVPVLLYVTGHVSPVLYEGIRTNTSTTYYTQPLYTPPSDLDAFFNSNQNAEPLDYTKIRITTPSDTFSGDLWIDERPPLVFAVKKGILAFPWLWGILFFLALSLASALLAGALWSRNAPVPPRTLLVLGLMNCLTMIGFIAASRLLLREREGRRRSHFVLVYYAVFAVLLTVITMLLAPDTLRMIAGTWAFAVAGPIGLLLLIAPSPGPDLLMASTLCAFVIVHMVLVGMVLWTLRDWIDTGRGNLLPFIPWLEQQPWADPGRAALVRKGALLVAACYSIVLSCTILMNVVIGYQSPLSPLKELWSDILNIIMSPLGIFGVLFSILLLCWSYFVLVNGTTLFLLMRTDWLLRRLKIDEQGRED